MHRVALVVVCGLCLSCEEARTGDGCGTSSDDTVLFEPPLSAAGHYVFAIEAGDESGTCEAMVSAEGVEASSCTVATWTTVTETPGVVQGDVIVPGTPRAIDGLLVGSGTDAEVSITVVRDDVVLFDGALAWQSETVSDDNCGEVERRAAVVQLSD